jgi:hypothetical protein
MSALRVNPVESLRDVQTGSKVARQPRAWHCSLELDADLNPVPRALARLQHHAQDAIDAEPGVPEAGVVHARLTATRSSALQVRSSVTSGWPTFLTRTCFRRS